MLRLVFSILSTSTKATWTSISRDKFHNETVSISTQLLSPNKLEISEVFFNKDRGIFSRDIKLFILENHRLSLSRIQKTGWEVIFLFNQVGEILIAETYCCYLDKYDATIFIKDHHIIMNVKVKGLDKNYHIQYQYF